MLREQKLVVVSLVGSLMVVMSYLFGDSVMERSLAEEDHAVEALGLCAHLQGHSN